MNSSDSVNNDNNLLINYSGYTTPVDVEGQIVDSIPQVIPVTCAELFVFYVPKHNKLCGVEEFKISEEEKKGQVFAVVED